MAIINHSSASVSVASLLSSPSLAEEFFDPLLADVSSLDSFRKCNGCSDSSWLKAGVWRCLTEQLSGRAFLQTNVLLFPGLPDVVPYFDSLRSERRLALTQEASDALYDKLSAESTGVDPFAQHPELADFIISAGDGHYHAAAVHDPRILSAKDYAKTAAPTPSKKNQSMDRERVQPEGTKYAVGHFFLIDLRTHYMRHLAVADQDERKKEHDMRALKALTATELRMGAMKGKKVIIAWDRAGIDFRQWETWKYSGIYFISLQKANMTLDREAAPKSWDKSDKRNAGVIADELCHTSTGVLVRRVRWIEPVSGEEFAFITSEFNLPPGLIAEIYRHRWDIERLFDETKNKLGERQAWASTATAKKAQGLFLCMAHNLMVHFENKLAAEEGITNTHENKRRATRLAKKIEVAKTANREVPPMWKAPQAPTQRCVKFIRWLRCWLFSGLPRDTAVAALAASLASG